MENDLSAPPGRDPVPALYAAPSGNRLKKDSLEREAEDAEKWEELPGRERINIVELCESTATIGEQTARSQDSSNLWGLLPKRPPALSPKGKEKLCRKLSPQEVAVIECIIEEDPERIFKKSGTLHRGELAKAAKCHRNAVGNALEKLRQAMAEDGIKSKEDARRWITEMIDHPE